MTRAMPGPDWEVHNSGYPSRLFTVVAFPPGKYELVEIASTEDWEEIDEPHPPPLARTNCGGHLTRRRVQMPFRIDAHEVTLLALPNGPADFDDLSALGMAATDGHVRERVGSWFPAVQRAGRARFRELVARQREPHDGYDVYPACDHKLAVVRNSGTPVQWEKAPATESGGGTERYRPGFAIGSVHATGFGGGCVRPWAYHLMLSDPSELSAGAHAVGAWLVANDLAGEVDLVLSGIPTAL